MSGTNAPIAAAQASTRIRARCGTLESTSILLIVRSVVLAEICSRLCCWHMGRPIDFAEVPYAEADLESESDEEELGLVRAWRHGQASGCVEVSGFKRRKL